MKKKVILPLLLAVTMIAGCGKEAAGVQTENAKDNRVQLTRTDTSITLPDGRKMDMPIDKHWWDTDNRYDYDSYAVKGLYDEFKHLEIRYMEDGTEYYFNCDINCDGDSIQWENIDTNIQYAGSNINQVSGEYYRNGASVLDFTVKIDGNELSVGNSEDTDNNAIIINGIEYKAETYADEARTHFTETPFTELYVNDKNTSVEARDIWADKDNTNFTVQLVDEETVDYMDGNGVRVYIGYHQ